jgi:RHS repeat-associated protein
VTSYGYDPVSRLASLGHDFAGTAQDLTLGFSYGPDGRIVSATRSNDLYAWTGHGSGSSASTSNGLNQPGTHDGAALTHDSKGNLTSDGVSSFVYSSENLAMIHHIGGQTGIRTYDPLTRLSSSGPQSSPRHFLWFGDELIGENYNGYATRYVHGPGVDEPLVAVWSDGTRIWLHADERGSIVADSLSTGASRYFNTYDEYGRGGGSNAYRFGFTGQMRLDGHYYYKARFYHPKLGRFFQPDPIGYGDRMNMYAYVGGDPVNRTDPSGLCSLMDVGYSYYRPNGEYIGPAPGKYFVLRNCEDGAGGSAGANSVGVGDGGVGGSFEPVDHGTIVVTGSPCSVARVVPLAGNDIFSRYGITGKPLGLPPYRLQGKTLLSTMYGNNQIAMTYFLFLHKAVDDWVLIPNPFAGAGLTSIPSRISYRHGDSGLGRIDIPANTFTLNRPESIHVSPQCPTKP